MLDYDGETAFALATLAIAAIGLVIVLWLILT